jgi:hypothetical protein
MWRLLVVGLIGLAAWANSGDEKIFVTYDYDNDRHYKNLLVAWAKNSTFDLSFHDKSVDVSVNSDDLAAIRRVVSARIKESSRFLCIIGKDTWRSECVDWEIEKARELGKPLIAVKTAKSNKAPRALANGRASWALAFKFDSIKKAIENAS